ncbi:MAG TPA: IMP cyclohydrolase [Candidatus Nanoarchaeia archaeon]|nr:IMP cyclohydrolase [Candidatus Nanoarchaeia archaeon]
MQSLQSLEEVLGSMEYPGRFLSVGRSPTEEYDTALIYSITGRSPDSQSRELVEGENTGVVRTKVTDPEVLKKGSEALLVYPAIIPVTAGASNYVVASNGYQTNLLHTALVNLTNFVGELNKKEHNKFEKTVIESALSNPHLIYDQQNDRVIDVTTYEPDPSHTPRISLVASTERACLHIVRCGKDEQKEPAYHPFDLSGFKEGEGRFISTYDGINQDPLQSFEGEPLEVKLPGKTPEQTAHAVYEALAPEQGKLDLRVGVVCVYFKKERISEVFTELHYKISIINRTKNKQDQINKSFTPITPDY